MNPRLLATATPASTAVSVVANAGAEFGISQGMLPKVDSSAYYTAWLAGKGWPNTNETRTDNSEALYNGLFVKAEIDGQYSLGIGYRNYYLGQSSAAATGADSSGHWIQVNETLSGNAQEYYLMFGTPYGHPTRRLKVFANGELGFISTNIDDATAITGFNGGDIGQHIDITASSAGVQCGLVGGLEWDFLRDIALSAEAGYELFAPSTPTVRSVTTTTGNLNASSQTQTDLRNADGSDVTINLSGLTGSLAIAWTW